MMSQVNKNYSQKCKSVLMSESLTEDFMSKYVILVSDLVNINTSTSNIKMLIIL